MRNPPIASRGARNTRFLRLVESAVRRLVAETFALRRQRSHVRIVSGAPTFSLFYKAICAPRAETAVLSPSSE
jgi:hypothetical protein